MSVLYKPVGWNQNKVVYDALVVAAVVIYILGFIHIAPLIDPGSPLLERPLSEVLALPASGDRPT